MKFRITTVVAILAAIALSIPSAASATSQVSANAANHCPAGKSPFSGSLSNQPSGNRLVIRSIMTYDVKGCDDVNASIGHAGSITCVRRSGSSFKRELSEFRKVGVGPGSHELTTSFRLNRVKRCTAEFGYWLTREGRSNYRTLRATYPKH